MQLFLSNAKEKILNEVFSIYNNTYVGPIPRQ